MAYFLTLDLHCDISGHKVGDVRLPFSAGVITEAQYKAKTGLVDMRCDACLIAHGSFQELEQEYNFKTKGITLKETAEEFIKKNRTRQAFDKEIEKVTKEGEDIVK